MFVATILLRPDEGGQRLEQGVLDPFLLEDGLNDESGSRGPPAARVGREYDSAEHGVPESPT